jgi:hypothetical protein
VEVLSLTAADRRLLAARCAEHGNSHRRLVAALLDAGATDVADRARALRRLERHFGIDLGSLCQRHARRADPACHPLERMVVDYVSTTRPGPDGGELWVLLDRLREVRELVDPGQLVREQES